MTLSQKRKRIPNLIESKFKTLLIVSIFGWIILLVGQVVDNVLAGNILGEAGLSAVQILAPFLMLISAIGSFVGMGFAVKFSYLKGKGQDNEANKIVGLGIIFTLVISLVICLLMVFLKDQLLSIFNMSTQVREYVYEYYNWYIGIAIVQPFYLLLFKVINQDGDPVWTVISSVGQVVINFVISAILIRVMGIAGLSLGSFISISISILLLCGHFFSKKNSIKIRFTFNLKKLKDPCIYGFPALLGNLSTAIVNLVLNAFIARTFGDLFLASFTLVCFVTNMRLACVCVSDSLGAFFSTAKGSGNNDDINLCFKILKKYSIIVPIFLTILIMSLCMVIPMMFKIVPESSLYVYCYSACLIIAPVFICYSFTITLGSSYTAIGKPKITVVNQIISNLLFPILFPIIFTLIIGNFYGIIIGYAVSAVLSIAVMAISLAIIHKPHKVFLADPVSDKQFSVDLFLTDECIKEKRDYIFENLSSNNIEEKTIQCILNIYDEACQFIKSKNSDRLITVRLTYSISDKQIKIFAKNNGRILPEEEKQDEIINHKEEHETLNFVYESENLNYATMISFNSQLVVVPR